MSTESSLRVFFFLFLSSNGISCTIHETFLKAFLFNFKTCFLHHVLHPEKRLCLVSLSLTLSWLDLGEKYIIWSLMN